MLVAALGRAVDWNLVDKEDYLPAMQRSPVRDLEIKVLLHAALTADAPDRQAYMKGVDASYRYEGYDFYTAEELGK